MDTNPTFKTNELQKIVDKIRNREGLSPIEITEENKPDAFLYAIHKSFPFFLKFYIFGIVINPLEERNFDEVTANFLKENNLSHAELNEIFDEAEACLPAVIRLYGAIKEDPMMIFCSSYTLSSIYKVKFKEAEMFKECLRVFHQNKKKFEKTENEFNK